MSEAMAVLDEVRRRFEEAQERTRAVPEATPPGERTHLTVGMATYEDFDGVFFTIEAIVLYHPEVLDDITFVVVDNHPEGSVAEHLKRLEHKVPRLRYVPFRGWRGTAVRDLIFREATSEHVVCVDSHVLLRPGALGAITRHLDDHPDDFVHGPLLHEDGSPHSTHFVAEWGDGMYGRWSRDARPFDAEAPAFEIEMSGLGIFACRRDRWPGLNPRFRGFGGEEGYLHEKVRRGGGRVVCLPAAGYVHRFARPSGPPYHNAWHDRIRNYLIGWSELGLDTGEIEDHFRALLGEDVAAPMLREIHAEQASAVAFFDGIMCLQLDEHADEWPEVQARFARIGAGWVVERRTSIPTPENHHEGCARSHRAAIDDARRRELRHVLVCEEDVRFADDTDEVLGRALDDLAGRPWDLLYLGGVHRRPPTALPDASALEIPTYLTCTHAVVYHHTAYDRILTEMPEDDAAFARWLTDHVAIDQYLASRIGDGSLTAFVTTPRVAAQPWMFQYEDAELHRAGRYSE